MEQNKFGFQPNIASMEDYLKDNKPSDGQEGPNWWSIPSGMSSVRLLPPWDQTGRVALAVYSHPIEFQGKGMKYKKWSWTCVNRTFGKPCNICQGLESIKQNGVDISNYEANRRTFYFNAIVIHDAGNNVQPGTHVLMKAPKTVYDWVVSSITNPMIGDITSITNGIDIIINKEGSGLGTTYTTTLSPNGRTAVPQEYLDKIDQLYNMDEIFSYGFEQDQVNELVASLNRSSNAMSGGIVANASTQMSGINPTPNYNYNTNGGYVPSNHSQTPTNNYAGQTQTEQAPPWNQSSVMPTSSPNPFANTAPTQSVPQPSIPQQTSQPNPQGGSGKPDCFGVSYSGSSVQCITCPHEIVCQQQCNK